MIRAISVGSRNFACVCIVGLAASASLAEAATLAKPTAKPAAAASASKPASASSQKTNAKAPAGSGSTNAAAAAKPQLVGQFGDWGAYAAKTAGGKTCYALAQPKDRQPGDLKRDPAYIFISERPAENVRDEISIIMGFDVKGGDGKTAGDNAAADSSTATAEVDTRKFPLVAKGSNLWLQNVADYVPMVAAMRKGSKFVVHAPSLKGRVTTDTYSLSGLAQALDSVHKECR